MSFETICVFGMGGVGGYLGGQMAYNLAQLPVQKHRIYFIARGPHLSEIQRRGLLLNTAARPGMICRPTLATDNVMEIPTPDLYLVCVKSYDLPAAIASIQKNMRPDTIILPVLNGADIYERIRAFTAAGSVLPACMYIGTHIESPGVVTQQGGDGIIFCGPDPARTNFDPRELCNFFLQSNIRLNWCPDPYPAIWQKYIFIAGFGLVTAQTRKTLGQVVEDEQARTRVRAIMEEITAIARKKKVSLPEDVVDASLSKAFQFPPETRTSYQRDVEAGRQNEGDLFGGAVIRMGQQLGIPTPATAAVYADLQRIT